MVSKVGKILVVDDNLGIRRALEILLPMHFAEVIATIRTRRKDIKAGLETCSGVKWIRQYFNSFSDKALYPFECNWRLCLKITFVVM
jgi:hypothetical protein